MRWFRWRRKTSPGASGSDRPQPFLRDGVLSVGDLEAEVIAGEHYLGISELDAEGGYVMLSRKEALALRDWLVRVL